jgi:hypothetical protein
MCLNLLASLSQVEGDKIKKLSDFRELEYENNVIREMIRCFMKEKSFMETLLREKNPKKNGST